eukprot:scaffold735_cov255-Pinguiococcus_pyrenoidosus.AAC.36
MKLTTAVICANSCESFLCAVGRALTAALRRFSLHSKMSRSSLLRELQMKQAQEREARYQHAAAVASAG